MAKAPSVDEAIERARRVQDDRIKTIEDVAKARQGLADVRDETARELAEFQARITARLGEAERADVKAFNAALSAGWSVEELKKIGFGEPEKKARARRRTTRKTAAEQPAASTAEQVHQNAASADGATEQNPSPAA